MKPLKGKKINNNTGKTYKVKPTARQKLAVANLLENPRSQYKALIKAGYSEKTAIVPSDVFESKGVKALIEQGEALGLTDQFAIDQIKRVATNESTSVNALRLWFQLKYPQVKDQNTFINNNFIVTRGEDTGSEAPE